MQSLVTVTIPFSKDAAKRAATALSAFGNLHRDKRMAGLRDALDQMGTIHFLSVNVLNDGDGTAHLILEFSADGGEEQALEAVAGVLHAHAPDVLAAAGAPMADKDQLAAFLLRHRRKIGQRWGTSLGLAFSGTPGMTVARINAEDRLAKRIQRQVAPYATCPAPAIRILQQVRQELWGDGEKWVFTPEPIHWLARKPRLLVPGALLALLAVFWPLLLLILAAALGLWAAGLPALASLACALLLAAAALAAAYLRLRSLEARSRPRDKAPDCGTMGRVSEQENHAAQNHLFTVSTLKPGLLRRLTLRLVLTVIAGGVARAFRPGSLGELRTIHFARWIVLPGTDKLLFLSNYGGSWESYLEDFIVKAHAGLTGIWSNTEEFPRARNLFQDGATDGDRFKRWARRQQRPTGLWYSAYPTLTTARIRTNAVIRQGIACATTEGDARDWLACFGSAARSPAALDLPEIPALVFGGFSGLPHGHALVVSFKDGNAKEWLAALAPVLTYGDSSPKPKGGAVVAAFSATGLTKLGLSKDDLGTFPTAFQDGMHQASRARALGDVGEDAPDRWLWGGPASQADALILLYAETPDGLQMLIRERRAELGKIEHDEIGSVSFEALKTRNTGSASKKAQPQEPFGFADGVSQPIILGTRRWMRHRDQAHAVAPGEFVLGYPDNRDFIPPSPTVRTSEDPNYLLPASGADLLRERPDFSRPQPTGERDFGRDGTFLVVRQLEQDVAGFNDFLHNTSGKLEGVPDVPKSYAERKEWIAAKLVGRWRDGTSLVRYPDKRGTKVSSHARPDNDFLYGMDDRDGRRCPLGAHIRRTNPRDSFDPGSPQQLAVSNRHRILRVGRSYPEQGKLTRPGLFFMCLNADIERQFEFVQQSWAGSQSFHGLAGEVDCFAARGSTDRITIPTASGPLCVERLADFVRVVGGGYFFLPGRRALQFLAKLPALPGQNAPVLAGRREVLAEA